MPRKSHTGLPPEWLIGDARFIRQGPDSAAWLPPLRTAPFHSHAAALVGTQRGGGKPIECFSLLDQALLNQALLDQANLLFPGSNDSRDDGITMLALEKIGFCL